jgi:hypothetical protein
MILGISHVLPRFMEDVRVTQMQKRLKFLECFAGVVTNSLDEMLLYALCAVSGFSDE